MKRSIGQLMLLTGTAAKADWSLPRSGPPPRMSASDATRCSRMATCTPSSTRQRLIGLAADGRGLTKTVDRSRG